MKNSILVFFLFLCSYNCTSQGLFRTKKLPSGTYELSFHLGGNEPIINISVHDSVIVPYNKHYDYRTERCYSGHYIERNIHWEQELQGSGNNFNSPYTVIVLRNNTWKIGNYPYNHFTPLPSELVTTTRGGCLIVRKEGKYGLVDSLGKIIVEETYKHLVDGNRGMYIATNHQNKKLLIQNTGKVVTEAKYDSICEFRADITPACIGKKWGYLSFSGKEMTKFQYDSVGTILLNLAYLKIKDKYGVINEQGKIIMPPDYEQLDITNPDILVGQKKDSVIVFSKEGVVLNRMTKPCQNYYCHFIYKNNSRWRYYNSFEKKEYLYPEGIDTLYCDFLTLFGGGDLYQIYGVNKSKSKNGYGVVTVKGEEIIKAKYEDVILNSGWVKQNGKWGVVNRKDSIILPFEYDTIIKKEDDKYIGKINKTTYMINADYKRVCIKRFFLDTPIDYWYIGKNKHVVVYANKKWGILDSTAQTMIIPMEYDSILIEEDIQAYRLKKENKNYYLLFHSTSPRLPILYDAVQYSWELCDRCEYIVKKDNLMGVLDKLGNFTIPLKYEFIQPIFLGQSSCKYLVRLQNQCFYINEKEDKIGNCE